MEVPDYYETLGVSRDAGADEIKKAYRKRAREWHPDTYRGDDKDAAEVEFRRLSEAYEVLSDPEKRAKYDQYGHAWAQPPDRVVRMVRVVRADRKRRRPVAR